MEGINFRKINRKKTVIEIALSKFSVVPYFEITTTVDPMTPAS